MGSPYIPVEWLWEDEDPWRHGSGYSISPSDQRFITNQPPLPLPRTSAIRATQPVPMHLSDYAPPSHGLPEPPSSYILTMNNYEASEKRQQALPWPTLLPEYQHSSTEIARNGARVRILSEQQLRRRYQLEDEAYPLKLVQKLRTGNAPHINMEKPVFGVIHVTQSVDDGVTVEIVGTYTTHKAANDRVMDFWEKNYGTGMFTTAPASVEVHPMFTGFEQIEEREGRGHEPSPPRKLNDGSSGGIPANKSLWVIDNSCLYLSQRTEVGEKKVYVVISSVLDRGIHS